MNDVAGEQKKRNKKIEQQSRNMVRRGKKKIQDGINSLAGNEKLEYDIDMLKGRIRNCEHDLSRNKDNGGIRVKIKNMKN